MRGNRESAISFLSQSLNDFANTHWLPALWYSQTSAPLIFPLDFPATPEFLFSSAECHPSQLYALQSYITFTTHVIQIRPAVWS